MDLKLVGQAAAITGGSEGIGRATAAALAREGCEVAIGARRADILQRAAEEISEATGRRVVAIPMDVTDPEQARAFVDGAAAALGRLDILVNNAGRGIAHPFGQATDGIWDEDLQLKLYGAIRCSRAAIPHLRAAGGGCIINITTVGGKEPAAGSVPTTVSRAAGIALTKAMSKDFAGDGIRVNTVMLGSIRSMQWERRQRPDLSLEEYYAEVGRAIPLGRIGRAEEVGDLIAFLVSPRAAYITGAAVAIDGGAGHVI